MNLPESRTLDRLVGYDGRVPHRDESFLSKLRARSDEQLLTFWRQVRLRKWWIVAAVLLTTGVTAWLLSSSTPVYRSTAALLIEASKSKVVSVEEVYGGVSSNREYFLTQVEFLRSREVAQRVIDRLALERHPEFDPRQVRRGMLGSLLAKAGLDGGPSPSQLTPREVSDAVHGQFGMRMSIEPVRLSQIVRISFESSDPELAATVANELGEAYIQADMDARFSMTQQANTWITARLRALKEQLANSENALQEYRDRQGIVASRGGQTGSGIRQLDDINQKLVEARVRRAQAEQNYNQTQGGGARAESLPAVVSNPQVARAREVEAIAERKVTELSQQFGPAHPQYLTAANDLKAARANTAREVATVISSIVKEYEIAVATERALQASVAKTQGAVQELNRKELALTTLESEVATNKQLYETFLSRAKETGAAGNIITANARLFDKAVPSNVPVWPRKPRTLAMVAALTLVAALLVVLLVDRYDNTLRTSENIQEKLGHPLLAALPRVTRRQGSVDRLPIEDPRSVYGESLRTALTSLMLSTIDQRSRVIAITSALPGEGKSSVSIGLALMRARTHKTVLVDMDLRKGKLGARVAGGVDRPGVAEILGGAATIADCVRDVGDTHLTVIPAGRHPSDPASLLLSPKLPEFLEGLRERYDTVILDTPPLYLVSDPLAIGQHCAGMVFVCAASATPVPMLRATLDRITGARVPVFGVVLNRLDFAIAENYYGQYGGAAAYGSYGRDGGRY